MTDSPGPAPGPAVGTSAVPIGLWRATYTPGTWVVLSGPTSMVVLSPAPGKASNLLNDMWDDVVGSSSIDDLIQRLAAYNVNAMPSFAAFFWSGGGLRSLVRGAIKVMDLSTGDYVADGNGIQTWTEIGLGTIRQIRVDMTDSDPDALQLPLVVGAVTASAVVLDATDAVRVSSPQSQASSPSQVSSLATAAGSMLAASAPAERARVAAVSTPGPGAGASGADDADGGGDDDEDDIGGSVIVADAAALAAAKPVGSSEAATARPPTAPEPEPASGTGRADASARVGSRRVDPPADAAEHGDEPGDEFDARPAPPPPPSRGPGDSGPGGSSGSAPFGPPAGPGAPSPVGPAVGATPGQPPAWVGAPQGYPQPGQAAQQRPPGQQPGPPQGQPGQPTGYPGGPSHRPPQPPPVQPPPPPPYGQPGQPGPYGPPNQPWGQQTLQPPPPQGWQPAGQQAPVERPPYGQPPTYGQPGQPGPQHPGPQHPGGFGPPQGPNQGPPQGPPPQGPNQGPPQGQPSASRPPAPQPSGPVLLPEDDADHDGATVFATSLARAHKVSDAGQGGGEGLVLADLCIVQHPNPPGATRCRICNGSIPQQGSRLVTRPVLAVLRPSQGQSSEVDRPVLIGRSPSADRVPRDQLPRLLTVPSPSHDISRTHVRVTPDGWELTAMDEYSTNGTILVRPGTEPERERLTPGEAVPIYPGNILDLGDGITITVEIPT